MTVDKHQLRQLTFTLAIIGLLITISGNFVGVSVYKKICYLTGTLFLLIPVILEKNKFFTLLETILLIGAAISFFSISFFLKAGIPIGLGVLAAIYFGLSGQLKDYLTWLSMIGILLGTLGYALVNPIIYFLAGTIVATYSFCSFRRGDKISLVFGLLNSVFATTALLEILKIL